MNERIVNHINKLFENAPKTRKALELKEELQANSEERYQDLIADGLSQEDAIKNVINSLGNVSELFQGLEDSSVDEVVRYDDYIKKAAISRTVAAGIYIFSLVVLFFFIFVDNLTYQPMMNIPGMLWQGHVNYTMFGVILAMLIDIAPTCLLVYITSLAPRYRKQNDTVVEDFKEWKNNSERARSVKNAASGVLWTACILLYFAVSFATYAWYMTWIIFLVAACLQTVIILFFRLKETS